MRKQKKKFEFIGQEKRNYTDISYQKLCVKYRYGSILYKADIHELSRDVFPSLHGKLAAIISKIYDLTNGRYYYSNADDRSILVIDNISGYTAIEDVEFYWE